MSGMDFTPSQLAAVDVAFRDRDTCVVAGPGSGKTTVLVEYFRRLVAEAGLDPTRILAITFTEKAAANMRAKLVESFAGHPDVRAKLERAWVSTVHGFCARLLAENAVVAGLDPGFTVLDEQQARELAAETLTATLETMFAEAPEDLRSLLGALSGSIEEALLAVYGAARAGGVRIQDLDQFPVPESAVDVPAVARRIVDLRAMSTAGWNEPQRAYLDEVLTAAARIADLGAACAFKPNRNRLKKGSAISAAVKELADDVEKLRVALVTEAFEKRRWTLIDVLARFDREYRARKQGLGALDFTDLEEAAIRLLEENSGLGAQFDRILMDEFQDTNRQQARLLELISPPGRLYAVGDVNQSIYGFRHAAPEVFTGYIDRVRAEGGHYAGLDDNFRSRGQILRAVETIMAGEPGIVERALVARRDFAPAAGPSVEVLAAVAADTESALEIEARLVARRAADLRSAFPYSGMAVLVRNSEVMAAFARAFDEAGIPCLVSRGKGFYETREVVDLLTLLGAIANPCDEINLAAVLRSPFAAVSAEALLRLRRLSDNLGTALLLLRQADAPAFAAEDWGKLARFRERLLDWRARRETVSFDRLLASALDACGYPAAANVDKFLAMARAASNGESLEAFVERLRRLRASDPREPDAPPEDASEAVRLMSVHAAKGLEFPVVFVSAMHKGVGGRPGALAFSPDIGLGARWRVPGVSGSTPDLYCARVQEERRRRETEEASRLLYVAMTRAEQHLILSFSAAKEWAEIVCGKLELKLDPPREEVLTRAAPGGETWDLRLLVAASAPPPPRLLDSSAPRLLSPGLLGRVQPVAPVEQYAANATVTDLALFADCPRRYYLARYLGWQGRVEPEAGAAAAAIPASEFGRHVHALLAGLPVSEPDAVALKLAAAFHDSPLGQRAARATRLEREFDFLMAVDETVVSGQIDLWFEDQAGIVIVDYKTDRVDADDVPHRAAAYALQLRLYAVAVERVTGRPPSAAYIYFLRPNVAQPVDLAWSLLDAPDQIVRALREAQSSLEFPLIEGDHCRRCPFHKDLCPAQ
jgi:ATP-dependent exoDNAse (exonuclease V) beta subunit